MVEQNLTRQQKRKKQRDFEKLSKDHRAALINRALWQIIIANGGQISITQESLIAIDNTAALQSTYDAETDLITITAGHQQVEEKSNLILPKQKEIIHG